MQRLQRAQGTPLAGVCGGLAEFLGWPARKVRLLWVVATVLTAGFPGFLAYLVLALVMPAPGDPSSAFRLEDFRRQ